MSYVFRSARCRGSLDRCPWQGRSSGFCWLLCLCARRCCCHLRRGFGLCVGCWSLVFGVTLVCCWVVSLSAAGFCLCVAAPHI